MVIANARIPARRHAIFDRIFSNLHSDMKRVVSRFALHVDVCRCADNDSTRAKKIGVVDRLSLRVGTGSAPPAGTVGLTLVLCDYMDSKWLTGGGLRRGEIANNGGDNGVDVLHETGLEEWSI